MLILALNCGSSSIKYKVYDWVKKEEVTSGVIERIGISGSTLTHFRRGEKPVVKECSCPDHKRALEIVVETILHVDHGALDDLSAISAVGHRVVHGGEKFAKSTLITDEVLKAIKEVQSLAPLHNPPNIAGIEAAKKVLPDVPHIAVFDTAFHQTMPPGAYIYAVPYEWYEKYRVRRYGFHGTSHLYVSRRAAAILGKKPEELNIITMHIGNGSSITAVKGGVSVDTSMGLTPLEGAVMGTRSGDIDPAIFRFIEEKEKLSGAEVESILNKKSGLLGITGRFTDRRDIKKAAGEGDERAKLAIEIEDYRLRKYIGAYYAAMGRLDAIVFTAGAGEHDADLRERALIGLEFMGIIIDKEKNRGANTRDKETIISAGDSRVKVLVIPTDEELVFIEDVVAILENRYDLHTAFKYSFQGPDFKRKG